MTEDTKPEFCQISKSVTPAKMATLDRANVSTSEKQELTRQEQKQKKVLEMYKIASETRNKLLQVPKAPSKRPKKEKISGKPTGNHELRTEARIDTAVQEKNPQQPRVPQKSRKNATRSWKTSLTENVERDIPMESQDKEKDIISLEPLDKNFEPSENIDASIEEKNRDHSISVRSSV